MKITVKNQDRVLSCKKGENLLSVLVREGIYINNPCNGNGVCGKCRIRIHAGDPEPAAGAEEKLLTDQDRKNGIRLSCLVSVQDNLEIEILEEEGNYEGLTEGHLPFFQMDRQKDGYGIAADIGTTTAVVSLTDNRTGRVLSSASCINPQKRFGTDVLTRITYEVEHEEEGIRELQQALVGGLNDLTDQVCEKTGVSKQQISEIVVAANCTMMHTLLGVDARGIGRAPYQPAFLEEKELAASQIGLNCGEKTSLYCLPHVSAYIGADIVAGAYVCEMKKKNRVLFVDIGTNGEMVLVNNGHLLCCSCAAGPALEGMNIHSGMRAESGAIEDLRLTKDGIKLDVIGGRTAVGICGSGILAVMKELLRVGLVKNSGVFVKKESLKETDFRFPWIRLDGKKRELLIQQNPEIVVTQQDIRQVQLAKGALLSGFHALLAKAGLKPEDLEQVLVAGQFGSHLPEEFLIGTGIFPESVKGKISYVGNTSKAGAYLALLSEEAREGMKGLAAEMDYFELAESENYERLFAECMIFPASETNML